MLDEVDMGRPRAALLQHEGLRVALYYTSHGATGLRIREHMEQGGCCGIWIRLKNIGSSTPSSKDSKKPRH